jgi:putative NADH-flavin reductase
MNVILYGATGKIGSRILSELTTRGHNVTAAVRNPDKLRGGVSSKRDDLSDVDRIAEVIRGADAVVSAYAAPPNDTDQIVAVTERQIAAIRRVGNGTRLIVVGGAAQLEVAPGVTALEAGLAAGIIPQEWVAEATSHGKALDLLKSCDINWTYFARAPLFGPGERTGKFRLGTDKLITDENGGWSRISFEDYALALVDELEHPAHERGRLTIGY